MPLPGFLRIEPPAVPPRRTLSLHETEQFLLLAAYKLWREDVDPIDGEALDKLRGALSPHPVREQNKQFTMNVLEMAVERMVTAGLLELGPHTLRPSARAIAELERAMAETRRRPEALLRRLLEA
jgi:integrase